MKLLSAILITYNEEKNIKKCLKSISFADEIIIVDSYSDDKTIKIAKEFTKKIFKKHFTNFSDMKNYGIKKAKAKWVLSIDADEIISKELKQEILNVITQNKEYAAYLIKRNTFFLGKLIRHSGWGNDYQIKLLKNGYGKFSGMVHEKLKIDGKIGVLNSSMYHYPYKNSYSYFVKLNRYTTLHAIEKTKRFLILRMIFSPLFRFLKMFILKKGFLDGKEGFILAIYSGFYEFIKYAKMWEKKK